jgi:LysR family glycine cleavage system transcriptional activator
MACLSFSHDFVKRRLPPLLAVRAFEAAGRRGSFTAAAEELSVTQGAISRQVKILENFLSAELFHREARGVSLTAAGRRYLTMATSVLDQIANTRVDNMVEPGKPLSISVLSSCASLWLLQRLSDFNRQYPEIRLYVSTSQDPVDFRRDGVDLALRLGRLPGKVPAPHDAPFATDMVQDWTGIEALHIWDEYVAPVCSRRLPGRGIQVADIADLSGLTLIHNASRPDLWHTWLRAHGAAMPPNAGSLWVGQRFMAVLAAREGQGVACVAVADINLLEWRHELFFPFERCVPTGDAYYLLYRSDTARRMEIRAFAEWLLTLRSVGGSMPVMPGAGQESLRASV